MITRHCDHVEGWVKVKDITTKLPVEVTDPIELKPRIEYKAREGVLIVCHWCGHQKEVYEDGTVIRRPKA